MSSDPAPPPGLSPDDALPPVEPPSAGFIVQLFVVPGVIVLVVVLIWVLFNWLAQKGNDRDAFVRALQRNNAARWQAAFNLAEALRTERGASQPTLATDRELARQLAGILKTEMTSASTDENSLALRLYLCRALGEFKVADGLPTLVEAASRRDEREADVRRSALEGIAVLASNVGADDKAFAENAQLEETLLAAAAEDDPRTRSVAAVAMGVIGAPAMIDKLRFMLEDGNADVRYNAAVRLAQRGDDAALEVLLEMLDPTQRAGVELEKTKDLQEFKRALITVNALRAGQQLAAKNSAADLRPLAESVRKLLAGDVDGQIRVEATLLARKLETRPAQGAKSP